MKFWTNLVRVVAPSVDVVTLAEVKTHLRIDFNDSDAELTAWIAAASGMIDGPSGIGIAMINQTWRQSIDAFPADGIEIRLGPVSSITSITYRDTSGAIQTLDPALYAADLDSYPTVIKPAYGTNWPETYGVDGAIKITFVAGYGPNAAAVPAALKAAVKLLIGHWNNSREAAGEPQKEIPFGVKVILDGYRNQFLGV
jgi:uncharacterized phiE125 gp8 family phage protein